MVGKKKEVLSGQEVHPLAAGIAEEPSRVKIGTSEQLNVRMSIIFVYVIIRC